jgi:hypothetical protein
MEWGYSRNLLCQQHRLFTAEVVTDTLSDLLGCEQAVLFDNPIT